MSDPSSSSWRWGPDAANWARQWSSMFHWAPSQPILPGWTFNINSQNSSSPQTEADVVQQYSYGRQLGRISNALAALIAERGAPAPQHADLDAFTEMKGKIDAIKHDAARLRVERLRADLAALKLNTPADEYRRLKETLRRALDD